MMILRRDNIIYYYKDIKKQHKGVIPLIGEKFSYRVGKAEDCNWPKGVGMERTVVINTDGRVFYLWAESQDDVEQWKEHLKVVKTKQDFKKRYKSSQGEEDSPTTSRAMKNKVGKQQVNRQRTKRFQSDDDDDDDDDDEDNDLGDMEFGEGEGKTEKWNLESAESSESDTEPSNTNTKISPENHN